MEIDKKDARKKEIIFWLNKYGRLSSSRFVGIMGLYYPTLIKLLKEMEKDHIIEREEETNAIYWILSKKKQQQGKPLSNPVELLTKPMINTKQNE